MNQRIIKIFPLILIVLMTHLFFPLMFIAQMWWNGGRHDFLLWMLSLYVALGYTAYISFAGAWSWFGRGIRLAWPLILLVAAVATFPYEHEDMHLSAVWDIESLLLFLVGTFFAVFLIRSLLGRRLRTPGLDLGFPLRGGTFHVGQGGSTSIINMHTKSPSQQYALDLLKINRAGFRASSLYPADPARYAIFGTDVVSPCDGVIAACEDGFPDQSPPERDPGHPAGNHIALECKGATIYMAHLMKGSLRVQSGQRDTKGQLLARVGNSGNTTEPHLHIHAEEGVYPGRFSGKPGIPIRFNGRFLVRNDRVEAAD